MSDHLSASDLVPFIPPAVGAVMGMRYAQDQTAGERLLSWAVSMGFGLYIGAAIGEYFGLGHITTGGVQFALAAVGMEIVAYVVALLRTAAKDPLASFRRFIDAILGRSDQ